MKPDIFIEKESRIKFRKVSSNATDVVLKAEFSIHAKEFSMSWNEFFTLYEPLEAAKIVSTTSELVDDTELINEGYD